MISTTTVNSTQVYNRTFWVFFVGHFFLWVGGSLFLALPLFLNLGQSNVFNIPLYLSHLTETVIGISVVDPSLPMTMVTDLDIGLIMSVTLLVSIIIRFFSGTWLDTYGRVLLLRIGVGMVVTCNLLFYFVTELNWMVYFAKAYQGVAIGILYGSFITYILDIAPEHMRAEVVAVFGVSGLAAHATGPILGEYLVQTFHSLTPLVGAGIVLTSIGWVSTFYIKEPRYTKTEPQHRSSWIKVAFRKRNASLIVLAFVFGLGNASVFNFIILYSQSLHMTTGLFFVAYSGTAILFRIFLRKLPDRIGLERMMIPSFIFFGSAIILLFVLGYAQLPWMLFLAGVLGGTGHGYIFPILSALFANRQEDEHRGIITTFYSMMMDVGVFLGSPVFGWIATQTGYQWGYLIFSGFFLASIIIFILLEWKTIQNQRNRKILLKE